MSIAYVVLKLEREGQSDPPPVLPFSKKPSLGRVKPQCYQHVMPFLFQIPVKFVCNNDNNYDPFIAFPTKTSTGIVSIFRKYEFYEIVH